uniref:Putative secreted protein n=1 Tax=Anopheles darlingi TaxID=43151 RepID=A0A2M4D7M4_ANODA
MRRQFRLETLVLLLQILHTGQITAVIIRTHQQLLLLDPALLISDITEELMQRVRLIQSSLTMGSQIADTFVALINRLTLLLDTGTIELTAFNERIGLRIHILDAILMRMDVSFHQLVLLH